MSKVFNRDVRLSGGAALYVNEIKVIDGDGNIDAPVTTTNLTTSGNTALGDSSADTITLNGTTTVNAPITVGVDDTGYDVKFFGATSGAYMLWDESADDLILAGAAGLSVAGTSGLAATTVSTTLGVTGVSTLTGGATIGGALIQGGTGAITATSGAGAVPVTGQIHEITTTGTGDALTLANGTAGQRLSIIYVAEGAGGDTAVLTPTTLAGGTTITFNALGDSADLVYSATGGWYVLGLGGTAAVA